MIPVTDTARTSPAAHALLRHPTTANFARVRYPPHRPPASRHRPASWRMRTPARRRPWAPLSRWGVVLLLACAGGPSPASGITDDGIYDFTASTGEATPLRGSLTIVAGDLTLRPEFGSCRVDQAFASTERSRFLCDNTSDVERLAFLIDHRFPLTRSTWAGSMRQKRTRTVCAQYATQNGRQVCVQTRTETVEVSVPLAGRLTFRPRPASD